MEMGVGVYDCIIFRILIIVEVRSVIPIILIMMFN